MSEFEKIALWWDEQHTETQQLLNHWVANNNNSILDRYGRVLTATAVSTAMELGAGLVDTLRLGEGVKEGGWGYAKDSLRLLSFAGPIFKLGRLGFAKWTFNPSGGWCASVATAKAIRHTGYNLFIRSSDIIGLTRRLQPKNMSEFIPMLKKLGVIIKESKDVKTLDVIKILTKQNKKSVIIFGVKWTKTNGKKVGHALYAYRDSVGRFRIADRVGKTFSNLSELNKYYDNISTAVPQGSVVIVKNAMIVEGTSLSSVLAVEVNAYLLKSKSKEVNFTPVKK
ncbi:hypothetical protein [Tunicatimonas pelagia]|uniref:hypothetical protein n=1 Tax=Tunicatimonas pelagia TaxID=931531 RepID=UPI002665BAA8|nr:hypothetical protein [Tunicatimonas pelagia]WKN41298.1 hypothetical protein P0M28_19880 [Tunicatimonas pelagia]